MKQYIKPELEIIESKSQTLLAASIPVSTQGGANPGMALTNAFNPLIDDNNEEEYN